MIYVILNLATSIGILSAFKLFTRFNVDNFRAIIVNYIVCVILALFFSIPEFKNLQLEGNWIYWSIPLGIAFSFGFRLFAVSTQKAGIAITSVAANVSVVIPVAIAFVFYGDKITANNILGILIAIVSFFFIFKSDKKEISLEKVWIFPALLFFVNGANNSMTKHAELLGALHYPYIFIGLTFVVALISVLIQSLFIQKTSNFGKQNIFGGISIGLMNFFSTYFFLNAVSYYQSSYFFPLYNLTYILLAAFTGMLVFKEKLKVINWFGILLAIFAILILTGMFWKA